MDLHLTPRELQMIAFTATRGSISSGGAKQQFTELFKTTKHTVGNLIWSLTEKGLLVKENKAIRLEESIRRNFNSIACIKMDISLVKEKSDVSEGN